VDLGFVHDLHCLMRQYDFSYVYNGDFSQALTDRILSFAETAVDSYTESTKVKKKLYFVMVESLQNVARHGEVEAETPKNASSFFIIQSLNKEYYLTSANSIEKKLIKPLRDKLEHVNSLDKEALKIYSNEILTQGGFSEKGGAGLGLVEMARRSGNKLAFDFSDIDDAIAYFYFQLKISTESSEESKPNNDLKASKKMHQLMQNHNLNLVYSGDFTQDIVKGILSMTEASIHSERDFLLRKKIFNVVVELLQNVYKHADDPETNKEGKTGMFMIGEKSNCYVLTSSNMVLNEKTTVLRKHIDQVNEMSGQALERYYANALAAEDKPGGAGIGFVDMRQKSDGIVNYKLTPVDADFSFFTVQVNVSK
jgi:hypothetical protein